MKKIVYIAFLCLIIENISCDKQNPLNTQTYSKGNLSRIVSYMPSGSFGYVITYEYDDKNRKLVEYKTWYHAPKGDLIKKYRYTYTYNSDDQINAIYNYRERGQRDGIFEFYFFREIEYDNGRKIKTKNYNVWEDGREEWIVIRHINIHQMV